MSGSSPGTRISATQWGMRGALAALALLAGYTSVKATLAQVAVKGNPALAHRLSPGNAQVASQFAWQMSGQQATPANRIAADRLAKQALIADPTAVSAVATLGLNAHLRGDADNARRLFAYSERLSRRNLATQVWLVENAARRGDVTGTLHHFDVALRTSLVAPDVLYPVLAQTMAAPGIRTEMTRTLADHPGWGDSFLRYVAANSKDPRPIAALFTELRQSNVPVPDDAGVNLINALITHGFAQEAWAFYTTGHPHSDPRFSRDPGFTGNADTASLFDWTPINDGGIASSLQPGAFEYQVSASLAGPVLQQWQMLPPGQYRIEGRSRGIEQQPTALPYWSLTCDDGRELGRVTVPNSAQNDGHFSGQFMVPGDCPVQKLTLVTQSSDAVGGSSGQFDRVQIVPQGSRP